MTLLEEIKNGENVALEFKEARPKDSLKFTKTVVAFANGCGGRLIFGIEDGTRNIVGIPKDKVFSEMDAIVNVISETCTPSISPDVEGWGGGVSRYFEKCAELGLPQPKVEELDGGFFRVTFSRMRDEGDAISGTDDTNRETNDTNNDTNDTNDANSTKRGCTLSDKLLKMIRANGRVTIEEMMRQCRVSRPTITRAISGLKVAGRVRRIGGTRGVWEIIG